MALQVNNTTVVDNTLNITNVVSATISANSATNAVKITQQGAGNALVVEDVASDTTPFVVDAAGRVGVGVSSPVTSLDLNGPYGENIVASSSTIDCSTGNFFSITVNGATTFTFSNAPASRAYAFNLQITHTSGAITWPASVVWPLNSAPSLTTGRVHLFTFVTSNGGTTWRGAVLADYTS